MCFITVDILRRGGVDVTLASVDKMDVLLSHKLLIKADTLFKKMSDKECLEYDCLFIPGGKAAFTTLHNIPRLLDLVKEFYTNKKLVCAICAAPSILGLAGILDNKNFTCYEGFQEYMKNGIYHPELGAVKDQNIITGRSMNYSIDFSLMVLEYLMGKDVALKVSKGILR